MVANANRATTTPQATHALALAYLSGRNHSRCYGHHGRRDHCFTEVGI